MNSASKAARKLVASLALVLTTTSCGFIVENVTDLANVIPDFGTLGLVIKDNDSGNEQYTNDVTVTTEITKDSFAEYWCLSETQSTIPNTVDDACAGGTGSLNGWTNTRPTGITLSAADGQKTIYLWAAPASRITHTKGHSATIYLDRTTPTVTIGSAPASPNNANAPTFGFSGDDTGSSGIKSYQCKLDSASYEPCTSPKSYTGVADGAHVFYVQAVDQASNLSAAATYNFVIDTASPTVTITAKPPNPTSTNVGNFTFTGSDGTGTGISVFECAIDGGPYLACTSPKAYPALADGSHTFSVRAKDAVNNTSAAESWTWVVDTTIPTVTINTQPNNPSTSATATFTFTGNDGTGSGINRIECRLGAAPFAPCNSPHNLTGLAEGSHTFEVKAIDNVGLESAVASYTWLVDSLAPSLTYAINPNSPTNATSQVISGTCSDSGTGIPVNGIKICIDATDACSYPGDYTISLNCTLGGYSYNAGMTEGLYDVKIAALDNAGNAPTIVGRPARDYVVDTTIPTLSVTGAPSATTNATTATFTLNGADLGGSSLAGYDCRFNGAAWAACTSPATYPGLAAGPYTFEARARDNAGNLSLSYNHAWTVDTSAPTVALTSAAPNPTNTSPIPVTITFSESVTGFTAADITVGNGTVSNFNGTGASYTIDVIPAGQGNVTVDVGANVAQDAGSNGNSAATQLVRMYDTVQPTVTLFSLAPDPTSVSPISVSITFSEAVSGFALGDLSVGNGTLSNFSGSGASYTVDITPTGANVTLNVGAGVATDAAGNLNTAATQFTRTFDNSSPGLVITSTAPDPTNTSPIPVTFTFSEPVTGFAITDIVAGNGTLSNFAGSGTTYTVDVTPTAPSVTVDVAAGVAVDAASNPNTVAAQFTRTYDNVSPTVTLSSAAGEPTNVSPIPVTITFSEAVTG
ncbi:MAG TPA: Ig-like domain-containing protein, partial [Bdellovibrionales bacterium]|nr:Ig-like domain-containing protein [Bdellovibrionales bacterium]